MRSDPQGAARSCGAVSSSVGSLVAAPAGSVLAALFTVVGLVRRNRPLHPRGVVVDAVLRRTGVPGSPWGTGWLDEPGEDRGVVRLSRAAGLPGPLPDVLGLAFGFRTAGRRHDLLLATTGLGAVSRFVLVPARDTFGSTYTSLLPYQAPGGPVVLAAVPLPGRPHTFSLRAAAPAGSWRTFGELTLGAAREDAAATTMRFDPVAHPLPGLQWPPWAARLREPSYAAARRHTPPTQVTASPPARTG